ncbi:MAG: hypothetical protein P8Y29_05650 [Gemmatimonadota bacterium]
MSSRVVSRRLGQFIVVGIGLAPATWLAMRALNGDLGVDPVETLSQVSGDWTLRFLLVTLAITPASRFLGKADTRVPLVYGLILAGLLAVRLVPRRRRHV